MSLAGQEDKQTFAAVSEIIRTASDKSVAEAEELINEILRQVLEGYKQNDPTCTKIMKTARIKIGIWKEGLI